MAHEVVAQKCRLLGIGHEIPIEKPQALFDMLRHHARFGLLFERLAQLAHIAIPSTRRQKRIFPKQKDFWVKRLRLRCIRRRIARVAL